MEKAIFSFNGQETHIQWGINEKFKEIIQKFKKEREINKNNLYFIKGSKEVPNNITFDQLSNLYDKENKSVSILVFEKSEDNQFINYNNSDDDDEDEEKQKNNTIITKMVNDINELNKNIGLAKLLKQDIQKLQLELNELKYKINKNEDLKNQL